MPCRQVLASGPRTSTKVTDPSPKVTDPSPGRICRGAVEESQWSRYADTPVASPPPPGCRTDSGATSTVELSRRWPRTPSRQSRLQRYGADLGTRPHAYGRQPDPVGRFSRVGRPPSARPRCVGLHRRSQLAALHGVLLGGVRRQCDSQVLRQAQSIPGAALAEPPRHSPYGPIRGPFVRATSHKQAHG